MIEHIVASGKQVLVISWRNPGPEHADWNLDRYVLEAAEAMGVAREITGADRVNLLGACAGGVTTTAILGYLSGIDDDMVSSVSYLVTVIDTEAPTATTMFASERAVSAAIARSRQKGVLEGADLARAFAWLRPNDLVWNYWVNNYLLGGQPPAFDVLSWNADSTNLPAGLHRMDQPSRRSQGAAADARHPPLCVPRLSPEDRRALYKGDITTTPELLAGHAFERLRQTPSMLGYSWQPMAAAGWSSWRRLTRLQQPTLVMTGDKDPLINNRSARRLARRIPTPGFTSWRAAATCSSSLGPSTAPQ